MKQQVSPAVIAIIVVVVVAICAFVGYRMLRPPTATANVSPQALQAHQVPKEFNGQVVPPNAPVDIPVQAMQSGAANGQAAPGTSGP